MTTVLAALAWAACVGLVAGVVITLTVVQWRPGPRDYRCGYCRDRYRDQPSLDAHEAGCPGNPANQPTRRNPS